MNNRSKPYFKPMRSTQNNFKLTTHTQDHCRDCQANTGVVTPKLFPTCKLVEQKFSNDITSVLIDSECPVIDLTSRIDKMQSLLENNFHIDTDKIPQIKYEIIQKLALSFYIEGADITDEEFNLALFSITDEYQN